MVRSLHRYNVWLNGYDATDEFSFEQPFSISHPSGDIKKVATYGGLATPEGYFQVGRRSCTMVHSLLLIFFHLPPLQA
jgi:hypothetical protein